MVGLLVHEWYARRGGSEQVFDALVRLFPDSESYVLWVEEGAELPSTRTRESWIAGSPLRHSKVASLPLMLPTWRSIKTDSRPDWLIVSSHLFAHHARVRGHGDVPKYVYAHTPARYIWVPDLDTRGRSPFVRAASFPLKKVDRARASEASSIAANSEFTRERIKRSWAREAEVIYPPVEVAAIQATDSWEGKVSEREWDVLSSLPSEFLLGASRFVPYKRLDLVIRAGEAAGLPVVIAGSGPEESRLRSFASTVGVPVIFVASPSNEMLRALYQRALVFMFPAIEDFGIMPVEAMAVGTPVVACEIGGASESVIEGRSGAFLRGESDHHLVDAVRRAQDCGRLETRDLARRFDRAAFDAAVLNWIGDGGSGAPDDPE